MVPVIRIIMRKIAYDLVNGNHDLGTGDSLPATYFMAKDGVIVHDEVDLRFYDYDGEKLAVISIPWLRLAKLAEFETKEKFVEYVCFLIEQAKEQTKNIVINSHVTIVGSATNGYMMGATDFSFTPADLDLFCKKGALAIFLGDIHQRQMFNEHSGYTGALYQRGFGEAGNPTGFRYVELSKGKVITDKFVDIVSPEYVKFEVETKEQLDNLLVKQEELFSNLNNHYLLKIYFKTPDLSISRPNVEVRFMQPKFDVATERTSKSGQEIAAMKEVDYIKLYCSEIKKMKREDIDEVVSFYNKTAKDIVVTTE